MDLIYFLYFLIVTPVFNPPQDWDAYINEEWKGNYKPFMDADLGYGFPGYENFTSTFSSIGSAGLKMGYTSYDQSEAFVYKLDEKYLFGKYASSDFGEVLAKEINPFNDTHAGQINTTSWSFGIGHNIGYGYKVGPFSLIPFNQNQLVLTGSRFSYPDSLDQNEIDILNNIEGDTRFGVSTEGGAEFYLAQTIAVRASFEGQVIFPRFKFWSWLGSFALQSISTNLVGLYSESIVKSSPLFGPIMYLILKNAITFAWFYAMKSEMYYPITSEAPFTMETIKLSASFTF
jgi:hypothetical protein